MNLVFEGMDRASLKCRDPGGPSFKGLAWEEEEEEEATHPKTDLPPPCRTNRVSAGAVSLGFG